MRGPLIIHHLRPPQGEPREGPAPKILGLTLHQPWATAIAHGGKRVENRSQRPWCPIGTYLAIHAGKALDRAAVRELRREGIALPDQLPSMAIVAVARLAGVVEEAPEGDQARWWVGPFGWVLDEVVPIELVPCKGSQGLWRLLPEVQAEVRARFLARRGIQTRTAS